MIVVPWIVATLAGALASSVVPEPPPHYATPDHLVRLSDGRRINFVCRGSPGPTVILEPGFGTWSLGNRKVLSALSAKQRVCAYDRAGLGFSDPPRLPVTTFSVASDLHEALKAAGERGPFILVGGSLGAIFVREYLHLYPKDVAGLVFVDPGGPERLRMMHEIDPEGARRADRMSMQALRMCVKVNEGRVPRETAPPICSSDPDPSLPPDIQKAYVQIVSTPAFAKASLSEMRTPDPLPPIRKDGLGDMPIIVLTAEEGLNPSIPAETRSRLAEVKLKFAKSLAAQSSRGIHRVVKGAPHSISDAMPEVVVAAISDVTAETRGFHR